MIFPVPLNSDGLPVPLNSDGRIQTGGETVGGESWEKLRSDLDMDNLGFRMLTVLLGIRAALCRINDDQDL